MVDIGSMILSLPEKLSSKIVNCILLLLLSGSSAISMYLCVGVWRVGGGRGVKEGKRKGVAVCLC